jgi:hypothetical protein
MALAQTHLSGDVPKFQEKLQQSMERFFQTMILEHFDCIRLCDTIISFKQMVN